MSHDRTRPTLSVRPGRPWCSGFRQCFMSSLVLCLFQPLLPEVASNSCAFGVVSSRVAATTPSAPESSIFSLLFGNQKPMAHHQLATLDPFTLNECACELGWADAFCTRAAHYQSLPPEQAPSICVCRQLTGARQCRQFLSRCFPRSTAPQPAAVNSPVGVQHRPLVRLDKCACCFNQPNAFCSQLECTQLQPQFEPEANTSCHCFFPPESMVIGMPTSSALGEYPPQGLCNQASQHWPRQAEQMRRDEDHQASSTLSSSNNHGQSSDSQLARLFRSSAPYARLVSLLLLVLLASLLLAVAVCFWSHWRRIRRARRKAKVEIAEAGPLTADDEADINGQRHQNGNALLREATV